MAAKAFVLVETAVGKTKDVINILNKSEGIKTVDAVTGPYDIIAVVEGEDLNAIGSMVTNRIHPIPGVNRTVTCLAIKVT
jgi:DNA-binding Lrp family transcriptional regulator